MTYIASVLLFVFICSASASSEKPEIDYDQMESDCIKKAGITDEELREIQRDLRSSVGDEAAQTYFKCMLESWGLLDEDGAFQETAAIEFLSKYYDRAMIEEVVNDCRSVIGDNKAENAINIYICYNEKLPD